MLRSILLLISLVSSSLFVAEASPLQLNGECFFLGEFNGLVPPTKIILESHSHSPSCSRFYINHKKKLKICVSSHTEKQTRGSGKNTKVSEHTVCDEY